MPKQSEIELPLLRVLDSMGGKAAPKDIYPLLTKEFPHLTESDLLEQLTTGGNKWTNRIQWVRQRLVEKGEMDSPGYGVWGITDAGRKRLGGTGAGTEVVHPAPVRVALEELYEDYERSFRDRLLLKLKDLTPAQFEDFASQLLRVYGFVDMTVTGRSADGGIDGYGRLRVGLATMNVAVQCKRWEGNVGRPEVDKFRGAIQGEYEQGLFFTTSDFTLQAREASIKKGAVPIVLLNGESIVSLMIDKGFGVGHRPLVLLDDRLDQIFAETVKQQ